MNWKETTEKQYWYALEVLPPAYMGKSGGFLMGEPSDHATCTITGLVRARYEGYAELGEGNYRVVDRPLTLPEFKHLLGSL